MSFNASCRDAERRERLRYHAVVRRVTRLLASLTCAGACAAGLAAYQQTPAPVRPAPFELALGRSTRLLVVAPHPDDEALGAAGLIQRVRAQGGAVRVVLLTSGDGFPEGVEVAGGVAHPRESDFRGYGVLREGETRAALGLLGVKPNEIEFLGFPDEGLCRIASTYLFDRRRAFESPYTGRESPPPSEQIVRGARYRGIDVRRELERTLREFEPTLLALPHPEDEHPDHCSTHIFVREAMATLPSALERGVRVVHYLVHYGQWPLGAEGGPGRTLEPPMAFPPAEGRWLSLSLTPAEADLKERALRTYTSQMRVIGRFMLSFARDNELFLDGEPVSTPECWCDGANVATKADPSAYRKRPSRP